MDKNNKIKQVTDLMATFKLTLADIETSMMSSYKFDLLCIIHGKPMRLPFEIGRQHKSVGIFPFRNNNIFLESVECEIARELLDEKMIPTIMIWEEIWRIRKPLNEVLKSVGQPVVDGWYYTNPRKSTLEVNWMVDFSNQHASFLDVEPCFPDDIGKIRYVGELKNGVMIPPSLK